MNQLSKKSMEFLSGEINSWLEEGIITQEQSDKILSLYDVRKSNLRMILFIAGGILLGLGLVSFIAAHWHEFPKILRVCMIIGAYLASLSAYIYADMSATRTGRAFLLLASVIFGAGIFLITRMYNYKLPWHSINGWWIVAILATVIMTRDIWQIYLAQFLSLLYLLQIDAINLLALEFVNTSRISFIEFFTPIEAFALIIALWLAWKLVNDRIAINMNILLTLSLLASRMSLCFGGTWTLIILTITGAVMSFISRWHDTEIMGLLMLGLFGILLTWSEFWRGETFSAPVLGFPGLKFWPVFVAVSVAFLMLVNIYRDHAGIGITFCFLLACRYFFDQFFGYMIKAWGFSFTGIIFMVAGLFFGRLRKIFKQNNDE